RAHERRAVGEDARHRASRTAVRGIGRGRHAPADELAALAHRARRHLALGPAEALRPGLVALEQHLGRPGLASMRIALRRVARPPTGPNICGRVSAIFTGRLAFSAAMAASTTCDQVEPLQPKPPPTKGDTTRTRSSGMPSVFATVSFTPEMYCVLSYSVRLFRS